ncbi:MAG: DUF2339 domain-containing protein [Alphaproteobacteria bacterium]|nr:DUF2339 domain-containing protein [Alphaproteobacteria bacterium]
MGYNFMYSIFGGFLGLAATVLGVVAFFLVISERRKVARLQNEIDALRTLMTSAGQDGPGQAPPDAMMGDAVTGEDAGPETVEPELSDAVLRSIVAGEAGDGDRDASDDAVDDGSRAAAENTSPIPSVAYDPSAARETGGPSRWGGLEESLSTRWLVWLGGVTLALAGLFLVKYSFDSGLLGPTARIVCAFLLGVVLLGAGEWLRRHPSRWIAAGDRPDYVPAALAAGGLSTMYSAVYGGLALYHLMPVPMAFALLATISVATVLLSLVYGKYLAVLGLAGAYATPALVSTGGSPFIGLAVYLVFVTASGLAVTRLRQWWWLGLFVLAGSAGWPILWMFARWTAADSTIMACYSLLIAGGFGYVGLSCRETVAPIDQSPILFDRMAPVWQLMFGAFAAIGVVLFLHVRFDHYGLMSLGALVLSSLGTLWLVRRAPVLDALVVAAAALPLLALATWRLQTFQPDDILGYTLKLDAKSFATYGAVVAIGFGAIGFAAVRFVARPGLWAGMSVAVPLLALVIAYTRGQAFAVPNLWPLLALVLAGVFLGAASWVARRRDDAGMNGALGAYAVGVIGAVSLFATFTLEIAWLTVALALQLPAIAWVNDRLRLVHLRTVAGVIASIVMVRLALNPYLLDYPAGPMIGSHWVLYGYGIPALAFYAAGKLFRREMDDRVVAVMEAGAIAFSVLLITFEIRILTGDGTLFHTRYGLLEQGLQSTTWLVYAYALFRRQATNPRRVEYYAWRILAVLATAQILVLQLVIDNPLFSRIPVGDTPILNLLLLAYGAPALLAALFRAEAVRQSMPLLVRGAGIAAIGLLLVTVNLEVRQFFHGSIIRWGSVGDAEWYAYSAAWIVLAGIFLALALYRHVAEYRHVSLGLLLLAVAKVFLFDMAGLDGLYRVASFFGLGIVLLSVGFLYQRFVYAGTASLVEENGVTS